jgi:uncharacterized protein (TIGR02466 family)
MIQIHDIFPTPIGISHNDYDLEEHDRLINQEYHKHNIYNMIVSTDKYVLNSSSSNLTNFINNAIKEYAVRTLGTTQKLKVTQSWCTKHENIPQETFTHIHQNSIISGVYYVNATEENEGLTFHKDTTYNDTYISWETNEELKKEYYWNWDWYKFPAKTGMLILFPSRLKHGVFGGMSKNIRCSLAFNTWFEDEIGTVDNFTRL